MQDFYFMLGRALGVILFLMLFLPTQSTFASLDYGKQSLIGADFSGSDLRAATFYLTNLQNADFSGSNLEGASFFDAKLENADLSEANLRDATMDAAILEGTNLTNAVLEGAFAFNTKFKDVNIKGADFTDVLMNTQSLQTLCSIASGENPITKRQTIETLNCN